MYGCEIWPIPWRKERRLTVFENRVLRKIFGPRKAEVTGKWRRLHNEELHDLKFSPNNIKSGRTKWVGYVARMGDRRGEYRFFLGRPEGKRPLERPRRRWACNIKWIFRK
jgi:hypothetical protein